MLLAITSLVAAAMFSGAAGYITLVEHPARLELENGPSLAQWQPSYAKALPIQSGLAVVGGVFAVWLRGIFQATGYGSLVARRYSPTGRSLSL